jgi:hypothetical protein
MIVVAVAATLRETPRRYVMAMTDGQRNNDVPDPQGYFWKAPYDWRRLTWARFRARCWNRHDPRLFTPRSFGWGWNINLYWVFHPGRFVRTRRAN